VEKMSLLILAAIRAYLKRKESGSNLSTYEIIQERKAAKRKARYMGIYS